MNILLETKNLLVNPSSMDDFENVYTLLSDSEVMRYVGNGAKTREEAKENVEGLIQHFKKHGFSAGHVYEKESGLFVGRAGLVYLERNDKQPDIEVGYILHKKFWGKGYATELTKAFIQWGFQHLPVAYFVAVIRPENEASRRVLEKSGMHYVGRTRCYNTEVAKYEILKNDLDYSKIKLIPATINDYPTIQNMGRFYVYDMSKYLGNEKGWELPEDGLYKCIAFKNYWVKEKAFPFLIRDGNEIAGFSIVNKKGSVPEVDFTMAQFFILRKYQRKKLGRYIAHQCFDKFSGVWEVTVLPRNEGAYRFWRRIIKDYTGGNFEEYTKQILHLHNDTYNVFRFNSKA